MLDQTLIEGFVNGVLLTRFDNPKPIPNFHRALWENFCDSAKYGAVAAPRGFAKSTSVTHTCTLAACLFEKHDFVVIVSDTESQASMFLRDIQSELQENETLQELFPIKRFLKETDTTLIVEMANGHKFRIDAKGAGQKLRGLKWRARRPNLILCDDIENDDMVITPEQRRKFKRWFFNALLPCGSDNCKIRVVGTVLHFDSLLENLLNSPMWLTQRFRAHKDIGNFTQLLWSEKHSAKSLQALEAMFREAGNIDGYAQEYLNEPMSPEDAFFRDTDLVPMEEGDYFSEKTHYAAIDFAISEKTTADYTVIEVAGIDERNMGHTVWVTRERMDANEIIDTMFVLQEKYDIQEWFAEKGVIETVIRPILDEEMIKRDIYLNITPMTPVKSKQQRATAIRTKMRAGAWRIDMDADWAEAFTDELSRFPRAKHDDQVDAHAWLGIGLRNLKRPDTSEELEQEEIMEYTRAERVGASRVTGY